MLAYIALVRSILEYGAVVCDPYQSRDIIAVEKVQRQAAHIWQKPFKNLLRNRWTDCHKTWYVASGPPAHHSLFK